MKNGVKPFSEQGHYTEAHNSIFDYIMPRVSANAFKVLCLILRRTKGWGKRSDTIAYSQITQGTGIRSDQTVTKALAELLEMGCILRRDGVIKSEPTCYALNRKFEIAPQDLTEEYGSALASKNEVSNLENLASINEGREKILTSENEARNPEIVSSINEASLTSKNEGRKKALTSKNEAGLTSKNEDTKENKESTKLNEISTLSEYHPNGTAKRSEARENGIHFPLLQTPTAQAIVSLCRINEKLITDRKANAIGEAAQKIDAAGLADELPEFFARWPKYFRSFKNNGRMPEPHEILETWGEVMAIDLDVPPQEESNRSRYDVRELYAQE